MIDISQFQSNLIYYRLSIMDYQLLIRGKQQVITGQSVTINIINSYLNHKVGQNTSTSMNDTNPNLNPYLLKIDTANQRSSLSLLYDDLRDTILQIVDETNTPIGNFTFKVRFFRIFQGPEPHLRIITNKRQIIDKKLEITYYYFSVFMLDLSSEGLQFLRIFVSLQKKQHSSIYEASVDPTGRKIVFFTQEKLIICRIDKKQPQTSPLLYEVIPYREYEFDDWQSILDIRFTPSADGFVGISSNETLFEIWPVKFNFTTHEMVFGPDVRKKCMLDSSDFFGIWTIAIDSNEGNTAIFVKGTSNFCKWNLQTMEINIVDLNFKNKNVTAINFSEKSNFEFKNSPALSGAMFFDSAEGGNFVLMPYDSKQIIQLSRGPETNLKSVFKFTNNQQNYPNQRQSKCIRLEQIDTLGCFYYRNKAVTFSKLNKNKTMVYFMGQMASELSSQQQFDIFYYRQRSQLCVFPYQVLECYGLTTKCGPNDQLLPLNKCQDACKAQVANSFWNPIDMKCQNCTNCECPEHKYFNPYRKRCELNCSKIAHAAYNTQYGNGDKCLCYPPFEWLDDPKGCIINCKQIQNVAQGTKEAVGRLGENWCKCKENYEYFPFNNNAQIPGICIVRCNNGKMAEVNDGKQYCSCKDNQDWNYKTLSCVYNQQKSSFPGWAIALIVIFSLALIAAAAFLIYRKMSKKQLKSSTQKQSKIPQSPLSPKKLSKAPTQNDEQQQKWSAKQQFNYEGQFVDNQCRICHKEEVNCVAPCGHYFHFQCVKEKINIGQSQCPECFKVFHGIKDFKIVGL